MSGMLCDEDPIAGDLEAKEIQQKSFNKSKVLPGQGTQNTETKLNRERSKKQTLGGGKREKQKSKQQSE